MTGLRDSVVVMQLVRKAIVKMWRKKRRDREDEEEEEEEEEEEKEEKKQVIFC